MSRPSSHLVGRLVTLSARLGAVTELAKVDLGQTREPWDYCGPMSPKSSAARKSYPSLSIYHTSTPLDIPDTGKATVDYRVVRRTKRLDQDGKETHDYDIEIQTMETTGGEMKPAKKSLPKAPANGKAVLLSALNRAMIAFDDRPRNPEGEYADTDGGVITPNQAAAAYGHPEQRAATTAGQLKGQALLKRLMSKP